ncbi:polysaccharide deacetylase family protein [Bacteroidota bacterium]
MKVQHYLPLILGTVFLMNAYAKDYRIPDGSVYREGSPGHTRITTWQGGKLAAITITYDDGTINQFRVARPIMNNLGFPGTFFINTGNIKGSGIGKFIGRAADEIIKETASIPANAENFFERASLIAYTGISGALDFHTRSGALFEYNSAAEAYSLLDEAYEQVRNSNIKNTEKADNQSDRWSSTNWEDLKAYTAEGHEIASHMVTHPRMAVLDEANMIYELEQSRADIKKFLGEKYTFSAECPFGTEDERVMEYAHRFYPALRNRMPEPFLEELNRSSNKQPGDSDKEYVQWQRGPLTSISMEKMKSWVDTCMAHSNIWLVLVFHGVDGIGWEARTGEELEEYFTYMKERQSSLWIATFADVTKYIRERKNAVISSKVQEESINVHISTELDLQVYNVPLTVKTYLPETWKTILLTRQTKDPPLKLTAEKDELGTYVMYSYTPGEGEIRLSGLTGISNKALDIEMEEGSSGK